jgi:N-acetylneuraminate synthase
MKRFEVNGRGIGGIDDEPFIVAEIGINHEGSLDVALEMAKSAIDSGAHAVKHQTHVLEDEMSQEAHHIIPGNSSDSIFTIMERCALSEKDELQLMKYVESRGCIYFSTPFSRLALERLSRFDVPLLKVGSGECCNIPLLKLVVAMDKPVIMSTGMHSIEQIRPSVEILQNAEIPFALLHTTNLYPTPHEFVRLGAIAELKNEFPDAIVGLSDHTVDNFASYAAIALGARIIEKHFTDSRERIGPDISCSLDPRGLSDLVEGARAIHKCSGGSKSLLDAEQVTRDFAYASVVTIRDIHEGELLSLENIWVMRPGGGDFSASDFEDLIGAKATKNIKALTQLPRESIQRTL